MLNRTRKLKGRSTGVVVVMTTMALITPAIVNAGIVTCTVCFACLLTCPIGGCFCCILPCVGCATPLP